MAYTGHLALRGACKVFVGDRNEFTFPTGYSRSLALSVSALELPLEAATTWRGERSVGPFPSPLVARWWPYGVARVPANLTTVHEEGARLGVPPPRSLSDSFTQSGPYVSSGVRRGFPVSPQECHLDCLMSKHGFFTWRSTAARLVHLWLPSAVRAC